MGERYQQMMEYYPTLVEAAVEFRVYSRKLLAENNSKISWNDESLVDSNYVINPEHETIPLSKGWRVEKDAKGEYYALQGN